MGRRRRGAVTRKRRVVAVAVALALIAAVALVIQSGILFIRGERVTIDAGDVTLAATIAFPRWKKGPFPAAVIVHGSGRTTRGDLKGYARRLVPSGLAVLMYDKRGTGQSTGTYRVVRVPDSKRLLGELADDAVAAVRYLKARDDIDGSRIGLVGGSQAGWIMPLAASRSEKIAFVVSISGPAVTYGQEIYYSRLTGDDPGINEDLTDDEIERRMAAFNGPHGYDPVPVLERLSIPSLWLLGARDRSVPTELSVRNLERIMDTRPGAFDVEVYAEGDHSLRDATTGKWIDYWPRIHTWLSERGFTR